MQRGALGTGPAPRFFARGKWEQRAAHAAVPRLQHGHGLREMPRLRRNWGASRAHVVAGSHGSCESQNARRTWRDERDPKRLAAPGRWREGNHTITTQPSVADFRVISGAHAMVCANLGTGASPLPTLPRPSLSFFPEPRCPIPAPGPLIFAGSATPRPECRHSRAWPHQRRELSSELQEHAADTSATPLHPTPAHSTRVGRRETPADASG